MLPSGWHRKEAPCVFQGHLSGIIVLRIGSRDTESILCVMGRLCSFCCLLLLQTVNVKMAFYWKHKYVFTSRKEAEGDKVSLPCSVFILWKLKQTNKKTPSAVISQINPSLWGRLCTLVLRDRKYVLHTFLPGNVAFNCGAVHGLENTTGHRKRPGWVRTDTFSSEKRPVGCILMAHFRVLGGH